MAFILLLNICTIKHLEYMSGFYPQTSWKICLELYGLSSFQYMEERPQNPHKYSKQRGQCVFLKKKSICIQPFTSAGSGWVTKLK